LIVNVLKTVGLEGKAKAPPSKSYSHRAIIAATLSHDTTRIASPLSCDDVDATLQACKLLGANIVEEGSELCITGPRKLQAPTVAIDCGESASTLRFLLPVVALTNGRTILTGSPQLIKRPIGPLVEALRKLGVDCSSSKGYPPAIVNGGGIIGGSTSLRGDMSSQYVTGLLFAAPLAEHEVKIQITTGLESKPYVLLTIDVLRKHGIVLDASTSLRRFKVPPNQSYKAAIHRVPGDYSSAAFLLAAAALTGSSIDVENLFPNQPDSSIVELLSEMGAEVKTYGNSVRINGGSLKGIEVDVRDTPDLVPVIAVLGCKASGTTRIIQAKRLRYKESDRLSSLAQELHKFGAKVSEDLDSLTIESPRRLLGAKVDSHGDHRIAMACTVLGLVSQGETEIAGAECVEKSYPSFFKDLESLGGRISVR
jgi:3-phosphoshikimate 1-carboxyvinyltransferase